MTSPDPVLTSAGYLLLKAGTHFHAVIDATLGAVDLTGRQFLVLTFAGGAEPLSQRELAAGSTWTRRSWSGCWTNSRNAGWSTGCGTPPIAAAICSSSPRQGARRSSGRPKQSRRGAEFLAPLSAGDRKQLRRSLLDVMQSRLPWLGDE